MDRFERTITRVVVGPGRLAWLLPVVLSIATWLSLSALPAGARGRNLAVQAGTGLQLVPISTRAELVSGGDLLIRIDAAPNIPLDRLSVRSNGQDVTPAFRRADPASPLLGLVTGLMNGDNTVEASAGSAATQLLVSNYPISGPVFSGPHEEPFICMTETFTAAKLGPPLDADCSLATSVEYRYKASDGELKPLADSSGALPAGVAQTTTLDGATVPYVVRIERGTINRAVYEIAFLHLPGQPLPDPWTHIPSWNQRLIYTFGGGCPGGFFIQGQTTGGVLDDAMLSQGYAVASASLNVFGNNCNDVLAAETMMMVKEHFIKAYGVPVHTIGWGCSGGSYQGHQIGDNYPGLLDGIVVGCSFPDVGFATIQTITDARLLFHYFTATNVGTWTLEEQRAVSGFGKWESIPNLAVGALRIDPREGCNKAIPQGERYNPVTNPTGARCDVYDHTVNVYGRDPSTGFARRPLDNTGIQYGLAALNAGAITKAQFLDLNDKIGGFDADANLVPQRTVADPDATRIAYESGRLLNGGAGLKSMPIIDYRAYSDDRPLGDIHMRFQSFSTRDRLIKANGNADNQVMLVEGFQYGYFSTDSPVLRGALSQMEQWLTNIDSNSSNRTDPQKVVSAKPVDLVDACFTESGQKIAEPQSVNGNGACVALFPVYSAPRQVAGTPVANDVIKCQLKPIDPSDYTVVFSSDELARLEKSFSDGVCDYSKVGIEQHPLVGVWQSFGR